MDWIRSLSMIVIALAIYAFGAPTTAFAERIEFVRVTCIPENQYLEIEYKAVEEEIDKLSSGSHGGFAKHGYLDPHSLKYSCKLGGVVYLVSSDQAYPRASGICGGAPAIFLTVKRGNDLLADKVPFGEPCNYDPSVMHLWFSESAFERAAPQLIVCIAPRPTAPTFAKPEEVCPFVNNESKVMPITPAKITRCQTRAVKDTCLLSEDPSKN